MKTNYKYLIYSILLLSGCHQNQLNVENLQKQLTSKPNWNVNEVESYISSFPNDIDEVGRYVGDIWQFDDDLYLSKEVEFSKYISYKSLFLTDPIAFKQLIDSLPKNHDELAKYLQPRDERMNELGGPVNYKGNDVFQSSYLDFDEYVDPFVRGIANHDDSFMLEEKYLAILKNSEFFRYYLITAIVYRNESIFNLLIGERDKYSIDEIIKYSLHHGNFHEEILTFAKKNNIQVDSSRLLFNMINSQIQEKTITSDFVLKIITEYNIDLNYLLATLLRPETYMFYTELLEKTKQKLQSTVAIMNANRNFTKAPLIIYDLLSRNLLNPNIYPDDNEEFIYGTCYDYNLFYFCMNYFTIENTNQDLAKILMDADLLEQFKVFVIKYPNIFYDEKRKINFIELADQNSKPEFSKWLKGI